MESDIQIRLALPDDAEEIARILYEAFAPFENFYTPEAFAATAISPAKIRERFSEAGAIWVVLKNGKIVGTVSAVPDGEKLYIRSMAVLPSAQGLGIGRKLLATTENFALDNGFGSLYLYTLPCLAGAIRLYERNGFETVEETRPEDFYGIAGLMMEKKLNQTREISENATGN